MFRLPLLLRRQLVAVLAVMAAALLAGDVRAQASAPATSSVPARSGDLSIAQWLTRMHGASRQRNYIGTFVVSSGANMSSAKIWHVCEGDLQVERVESLSGEPRSTFRRNDQVITFLPHSRTAVAEKRESLGLFPELLRATDPSIDQFYSAQEAGVERVAGHESDIVQLKPRDKLRFGYRIWSEKSSGMLMKVQTLDVDGTVLEQSAFSELQMDAPVSVSKLTRMMDNTEGYRVDRPALVKTTATAEGWAMKNPVAGFRPMSCQKRPAPGDDAGKAGGAMQWVFSDGLASVSLFVEAYDARRHKVEGVMALGATHALTRRLSDKSGEWWLTVIGEVPIPTLAAFAQGLERTQ
ncbi:MAG: MucB/RseB C-terminal domain-containing protein [Burkholderiaceae bacterium]